MMKVFNYEDIQLFCKSFRIEATVKCMTECK